MVNLKDSTVFDYIRYVGSFALLMFSTVVTFYAIWEQKTSFWKAVPGWAALIIFLLVLFLLGVMEGIQIALVELKRQDPETYKESHPQAYRLGQIAAKGDNIERFLMGRQVLIDPIILPPALHSLSGLRCLPRLLRGQADDNPREKP